MGNVFAVGMSNTDLVCVTPRLPIAGETVAGTLFEVFAGGKGANQAVAAARSGANVWFGGAVGDDDYGRDRLSDLKAAGVDVSAVQTIQGVASGIALIVVDEAGSNQIVTVAGANDLVDADALVERMATVDYDVVLLTWELDEQTSLRVLERTRPDSRIVLTTAPYSPSVRDIFPDQRVLVVANRVEASQMLGRSVSADDALEAVSAVQRLGCEVAIITLGSGGAAWAASRESGLIPAPEVEVVDTTGAGDAFCGAFAAWLADGATVSDAVRAGVHAGACSVTRRGAQPSLPTRAEIVHLMERSTQ